MIELPSRGHEGVVPLPLPVRVPLQELQEPARLRARPEHQARHAQVQEGGAQVGWWSGRQGLSQEGGGWWRRRTVPRR